MTKHKEVGKEDIECDLKDLKMFLMTNGSQAGAVKRIELILAALSKTSGVGEIKKVLNMCLSIVEAGNHFDSESIDKLRALTERINNEYN